MRLRSKMFIGSAFLAIIPVIFTAYITSDIASQLGQKALHDNVRNHLTAVRDNKNK